jgi:hypothetical protein
LRKRKNTRKADAVKTTPGPWMARGAEVLRDGNDLTRRAFIADCDNHAPHILDEEGEANAQLIAAAPELLDACKKIHSLLMRATTICGDMTPRDIIESAGATLSSALYKASGFPGHLEKSIEQRAAEQALLPEDVEARR